MFSQVLNHAPRDVGKGRKKGSNESLGSRVNVQLGVELWFQRCMGEGVLYQPGRLD